MGINYANYKGNNSYAIEPYNGYSITCEYSEGTYHGKVEGVKDLLIMEADTITDFIVGFHNMIDNYENRRAVAKR